MVASWASRALVGPAREAVKWLADENFDNAIIRGLLRQVPTIDILRAQDTPEVAGQDDSVLLSFATEQGRVVVTHDVSTMIPAMRERPGVLRSSSYRIQSRLGPRWRTS